MSTVGWQDEVEMEMNGATCIEAEIFLDNLTPQQLAAPFEEDFQQFYSSDGLASYATCFDSGSNNNNISSSSLGPDIPRFHCERSVQGLTPEAVSSSDLLSLYNSTCKDNHHQWGRCLAGSIQPRTATTDSTNFVSKKTAPKSNTDYKRSSYPSNEQPHSAHHVMAERKRRADLSQRFMDLTAIVPSIRKMDKVTILEDSMKYIKQLQKKATELEQQSSQTTIESAVFVQKPRIHSDEDFACIPQPLRQIEASVSDRNVLIRIYCEAQKGILAKAVQETEKHNLNVVSSGVIPFGNSTLDITLMAQMDADYRITTEDLVKSLRSSLTEFMGKAYR